MHDAGSRVNNTQSYAILFRRSFTKTIVSVFCMFTGTVDSWILFNLIGKHMTDVTNASRTFLYDIENLRWSENVSFYRRSFP